MSVILYNFLILILSGRLQLLILVTFHSCFLSIIYAGASYLANDLATETATCTYTEAATQRCSQERGVLKTCSKFTGEHSCRSAISIKLESNFTEMTLRHGCSPINLLHIFRTSFPRNTSGQLLLHISAYNTILTFNHRVDSSTHPRPCMCSASMCTRKLRL